MTWAVYSVPVAGPTACSIESTTLLAPSSSSEWTTALTFTGPNPVDRMATVGCGTFCNSHLSNTHRYEQTASSYIVEQSVSDTLAAAAPATTGLGVA
jgi:hypothetical protein